MTTTVRTSNDKGASALADPARPECRLLRHRGVRSRFTAQHGFSLIELLMVVALIAILAGVAVGVTPGIIRSMRAEGAAVQMTSFLKRTREMAISRRRNIEVRFLAPNRIQSAERAVPVALPAVTPGPTVIETMTFEGGLTYRIFNGQPDTPDLFGRDDDNPVNLGGADPVMFTTEGSFADANGDPINATIFVGVEQNPLTANAVTIVGVTSAIRGWRWDGRRWVQ